MFQNSYDISYICTIQEITKRGYSCDLMAGIMVLQMRTGKLYRLNDNQFITNINYQLYQHPGATDWWGEITLTDYVQLNEGDTFVIELEDNRRSTCHLKKRVNRAVSGIPTRYIYRVTGLGPIE